MVGSSALIMQTYADGMIMILKLLMDKTCKIHKPSPV